MKNLRVIVVGGGIGGLQTALALGADSHQVIVLEAAEKFLEVIAHSIVHDIFRAKLSLSRWALASVCPRTLHV